MKSVIVTGGAGFIGSAVCRHLIVQGYRVVNVDKLTYAADLANVAEVEGSDRYSFVKLDICDTAGILELMRQTNCDGVLHLAAESHVDRSIESAAAFVTTNVVGTVSMLEAAHTYWVEKEKPEHFRFLHVSTDEVFGDLDFTDELFVETSRYKPSSPYSASKASSDHFVNAWQRTYDLPCLISNCSNNYGPYQFPEKLIPLMITNAVAEKPLPIYGNGQNIRDWLYVEDHAIALQTIFEKGKIGETYNVGGNNEYSNMDVVKTICKQLDETRPRKGGGSYEELITFVTDRLGHDLRYAIDAGKIEKELGWKPTTTFPEGIAYTIDWYLNRL